MPLKAAAAPLVITLTQGSADAFVQSSVLTGLSGNQAYNLVGVAWQFASTVVDTNNVEYTWHINRRSKAAIALLSDTDIIMLFGFQMKLTTSGASHNERAGYWKPEVQIPIVEETLYACLDSTSSSTANTVILRLDVELDTMQPIDRLNLITRSLT